MNLFQLTAVPLLCLFVGILRWNARLVPSRLALLSLFLKGVLLFIPAYIVLLILNRIVGLSYTGFGLYVCLLVRDHLAPLLLGTGGLLLVSRRLPSPATEEGIFLSVFTFLCGFYTLFGPADFVARFGHWGMESLFLLPLLRLSAILAVSFVARRFYRWEGRSAVALLSVSAAIVLPLAFASWTYGVNFRWIGTIMSVVAFLSMGTLFAARFPAELRIR